MLLKDNPRIKQMFDGLENAPEKVLPSKFWKALSEQHLIELQNEGYENFKRTLALKYFTFLPGLRHEQTRFLRKNLPTSLVIKNFIHSLFLKPHRYFSFLESFYYNFFTCLFWDYIRNTYKEKEADIAKLSEPLEGNPPRLYAQKRPISQDLANSFLEFNAIMTDIKKDTVKTILELGAGYGRTAYVFLTLLDSAKYIIADIPPALYISETYLSHQFPQKRVFKFRNFNRYSDIEEEFSKSEIAFFLPHQLELLPPKSIDLSISISSFHEMRVDQIEYYFNLINRLSRHIYFKQGKIGHPYEGRSITESDYPIQKEWTRLFWRECPVQTSSFEALFRIN